MAKVVITCEHGGNVIPEEYQVIFQEHKSLLESHLGWDIGAIKIARAMATAVGDLYFYTKVSRLLIEMNRSLRHPRLFSTITKPLNLIEKTDIIKKYYSAYRNEVESKIHELIEEGEQVIHISVHSFSPILGEKARNNDIGLLYDPVRPLEKKFCYEWKQQINKLDKRIKVRFNFPYLGAADGFVTYLRRKFSWEDYIGIELEVNQKFFLQEKNRYGLIKKIILLSVKNVINNW